MALTGNQCKAKLEALMESVESWLAGKGNFLVGRVALDLFSRFATVRDHLREACPDAFSDFPVRETPRTAGTAEGEPLVALEEIRVLRQDIR